MNYLVGFLIICFMQYSLAGIYNGIIDHKWKIYSDEKKLLILIEGHNVTGDVYVAAENVIYHFNADLILQKRISTGPELDHPECLHPSIPCEYKKLLTDNKPFVLKILYHMEFEMLMVCGSLYQGLCQVRPLQNLDDVFWIGPYNESVGLSQSSISYALLFGPGYNGQIVLYSGNSYFPNSLGKFGSLDLISSRVLQHENNQFTFKYAYSSESSFSRINFGGMNRVYVKASFIVDNYIYFLLLISSDAGKEPKVSARIARICLEDGTLHSYTELPIFCIAEDFSYYVPTDMVHNNADNKLFVSFIQYNDPHASGESAICTYDLNDMNQKFNEVIRDCFKGSHFTHLKKLFSGDLFECHQELEIEEREFCGNDINPYIVSERWLQLDELFTAVIGVRKMVLVQQNNYTVGFLLPTISGVLLKYIFSPDPHILNANELFRNRFTGHVHMPNYFAFDVQQEHIYFLGGNTVVKFPIRTCSIYETCYSCLAIGRLDPLRCGWCDGHCAQRQECSNPESFSNSQCTPVIYKIKPLKGLQQGGTTVSIFGADYEDVDKSNFNITVAGIPCHVRSTNNERIMCQTERAPSEISGPVVLSLKNVAHLKYSRTMYGSTTSNENFSYVTPHLYGIYPSKGAMSGGTNVTLFGKDLDIGQQVRIGVQGRYCLNIRQQEQDRVQCTTQSIKGEGLPLGLMFVMDGTSVEVESDWNPDDFEVPFSQSFSYLPDPEIYEIYPTRRAMSEKLNVTINGKYLNSVDKAYMLVTVSTPVIQNLIFQEPCWLNPESNGTVMICSTPELLGSETRINVAAQSMVPLVAHMAFLMDGVQELRNFPKEHEELSRLLYYPDPEYEPFAEIREILGSQAMLEIKGRYLDSMYVNRTFITIDGEEVCNISSLTADKLQCILPPNIMSNSALLKRNLSVEVFAGPFKQHLGYVVFMEDDPTSSLMIILVPILVIILFIIIVIFIIYRLWIRKEKGFPYSLRGRNAIENNEYGRVSFLSSRSSAPLIDEETMCALELENLIILKEHLIQGNMIGAGQFGCVFEGKLHRPEDKEEIRVAVKTVRDLSTSDRTAVKEFLEEVLLMRNFHHENVLSLIGVCFQNEIPMVVLPFMANGDLCTYLRNEENDLWKDHLLKFQVDIASGMANLALYKFVHRDLAARNCVLDSDLTVKVADFGLSRDIYEEEYYRSEDRMKKMPLKWMSPEAIEFHKFSEQTDVWSFGVVMWEIMTRGVIPYNTVHNWQLLSYLKSNLRLPQPEYCSERLYEIMLHCWHQDPAARPTFEVLKTVLEELWKKAVASGSTENKTVTTASQSNVSQDEDLSKEC